MKMDFLNNLRESLPVAAPRIRKKRMKVPPPPPPVIKKLAPPPPPIKKSAPPPPPLRKSSLKPVNPPVVPPKRRTRSKTSAELQEIITSAQTHIISPPTAHITPQSSLQVDCKDQESLSSDFSSLSPSEERNGDNFEPMEENNNLIQNTYEKEISPLNDTSALSTMGLELTMHALEEHVELKESEPYCSSPCDDYFMKRSKFTEDTDLFYDTNAEQMYSEQSNISKYDEIEPSEQCKYVDKNLDVENYACIPPALPLCPPPCDVNNVSPKLALSEKYSVHEILPTAKSFVESNKVNKISSVKTCNASNSNTSSETTFKFSSEVSSDFNNVSSQLDSPPQVRFSPSVPSYSKTHALFKSPPPLPKCSPLVTHRSPQFSPSNEYSPSPDLLPLSHKEKSLSPELIPTSQAMKSSSLEQNPWATEKSPSPEPITRSRGNSSSPEIDNGSRKENILSPAPCPRSENNSPAPELRLKHRSPSPGPKARSREKSSSPESDNGYRKENSLSTEICLRSENKSPTPEPRLKERSLSPEPLPPRTGNKSPEPVPRSCTKSPEPLPRSSTLNDKSFVEINKPISNERPLYKFFTPPVFQPYNPVLKPWQPSSVITKIKPVEFNVNKKIDIVTPKQINTFDNKSSFLASTLNVDTLEKPNVSIDWPEISPASSRKNSVFGIVTDKPEAKFDIPETISSRGSLFEDLFSKINKKVDAPEIIHSSKHESLLENSSLKLSKDVEAFKITPDSSRSSSSENSSPKLNKKVEAPEITPSSSRRGSLFENLPRNGEKYSENIVNSKKRSEMSPKYTPLTKEEIKDHLSLPELILNECQADSLSSDELTTDSHIDRSSLSLINSCINDDYPQHLRQPSPLRVSNSFSAVWSRTGSIEVINNDKDNYFFSDIPNLPFGVAAVSPCNDKEEINETCTEKDANVGNIKKSFDDFTKHMLANDYTLVEVPKLARIRGPSKDEEDIVLSHLEAVLMEEVDEWTEEVRIRSRSASVDCTQGENKVDDDDDDNFDVDWSMFAVERNKVENSIEQSSTATEKSFDKDEEISNEENSQSNDLSTSARSDEQLNHTDGEVEYKAATRSEEIVTTQDHVNKNCNKNDEKNSTVTEIETQHDFVITASEVSEQDDKKIFSREVEAEVTIDCGGGGVGATMENTVCADETDVPPAPYHQIQAEEEEEDEIVELTLEKMWGSLGIRLELVCVDEIFMVAIAQVMPGGAAEEAGTLLPGDRLLEVNGQPTSTLEETVRLFRVGPDIVHLRLLRHRIDHDENYEQEATTPLDKEIEEEDDSGGMGSNVSRHSEKGLCRRSQSSGNLAPLPRTKALLVTTSNNSNQTTTKLCGSLPNHLDRNDDDDPENNNGGMLDLRAKNQRNVELRLQTLLPPPLPSGTAGNKSEPLQLLLPPPPLFHDPVNDQGYGSERSPEDENPPPLLPQYPFIKRESLFEVRLTKGTRGLGLSVTGGADSTEPWPGLVRVKRLFPHQPAWTDGRLAPGDVLLEANSVPLTGLSNYEALEVLRTAPSEVILRVSRPPAGTGLCSVDPDEQEKPLAPPRHRTLEHKIKVTRHPCTSDEDDDQEPLSLLSIPNEPSIGEFEIELTKVAGSLGFTLRKEDESILGHYVRALVREPAVSDGRIRPGDKIVAVNGVDISPMSHEEAVGFLRKCGETVSLRLYRDNAQTPVAALSPTDGCKTFPRARPLLRKEAMDMLSDLAGRKMSSPQESGRPRRASEGPQPSGSPSTSPRRRRLTRTPPSPEPTALLANGSANPVADVMEETGRASLELSLQALAAMDVTDGGDSTPRERPSSLDLSTPSSLRKQKFLFTSPPASSTFSEFGDEDDSGSVIAGLSPPNEYPGPCSLVSQPASMPPIRVDNELAKFSYRNPAYQSAAERPVTVIGNSEDGEDASKFLNCTAASPATASSDQDIPKRLFGQEGPQGLLKWKGVVFTPENEEAPKTPSTPGAAAAPVKSSKSTPTNPKAPPINLKDRDGKVLTVELTRGWNSRLGFTLHAGDDDKTLIKAIYPDSVAFRDGRLKPGDHVIMVNEESIEHMPTSEVIDLVRKIRGTVAITILRPLEEPR